jgi:ankyrin repeat protein
MKPIHLAVYSDASPVVELLLEKGVDINIHRNHYNATPLQIAVSKGFKNMAAMLLDRGADMNIRDSKGRTALALARKRGNREMIELLEVRGGKR